VVVLVVKGGVTMSEDCVTRVYACPRCGGPGRPGGGACARCEAGVRPLRNSDADPLPFKTLPDVDFPDWKYCVTTKTVYFAVVSSLRVLDNGLAEVVITNVTDAARFRLGDRVTIQHEGGTKA